MASGLGWQIYRQITAVTRAGGGFRGGGALSVSYRVRASCFCQVGIGNFAIERVGMYNQSFGGNCKVGFE